MARCIVYMRDIKNSIYLSILVETHDLWLVCAFALLVRGKVGKVEVEVGVIFKISRANMTQPYYP